MAYSLWDDLARLTSRLFGRLRKPAEGEQAFLPVNGEPEPAEVGQAFLPANGETEPAEAVSPSAPPESEEDAVEEVV